MNDCLLDHGIIPNAPSTMIPARCAHHVRDMVKSGRHMQTLPAEIYFVSYANLIKTPFGREQHRQFHQVRIAYDYKNNNRIELQCF
jgi:hypothetical protein